MDLSQLSAHLVEIYIGAGVVGTALVAWFFVARAKRPSLPPPPKTPQAPTPKTAEPAAAPQPEVKPVAPTIPRPPSGLELGLGKTRKGFWDKVGKFLHLAPGQTLSNAEWDEIEEALLAADVGVTTSALLMGKVRDRFKTDGALGLRSLFTQEGQGLFSGLQHGIPQLADHKPTVISIVGVNGAGKTTTIGKLAHRFMAEGKQVLIGAGDTFRAAAILQLKTWADRVGTDFVTGREGGDPGAVAFDSLTAGKARGKDIVLFDTAGRLHTKSNLMDELVRVHKVMKKVMPEAPHETWLVIDGTLGQNSVQQAREFSKALPVTGVVITKLDGTAKGGAVFSIVNELKLPIRFIGVGEKVEDLVPFEPKPFVDAILNPSAV